MKPVLERTATGTVRCSACKQEWISAWLTVHADPQCLMWLLGREMLTEPT